MKPRDVVRHFRATENRKRELKINRKYEIKKNIIWSSYFRNFII